MGKDPPKYKRFNKFEYYYKEVKGKNKSKSIAKKKKKTYNYPKDNSLNKEKNLDDSSYDKIQRINCKSRKEKKIRENIKQI